MQFLISTRLLASIIAVPLLVLIGNIIGVFGGFIVATFKLDLNPVLYMISTLDNFNSIDLIQGLIKALVFGMIISVISCYFGFNASGGAEGVGRATTVSVVTASTMILTSTYFITALFI